MTLVSIAFAATSVFALSKPINAIDDQQYSQAFESCQQIEKRLEEKSTFFNQKRLEHSEKYANVLEMYKSVTSTLNQAGYGAELLTELTPGLERRIEVFSQASQSFVVETTDAADSACRERASFRLELEEARNSLQPVQQSVADIHRYVQDILIPAIKSTVDEGVRP
jgi:hypothetical protein